MKQVALPILLISALVACGKSEKPSTDTPAIGGLADAQGTAESASPPAPTKNVPLDQYVEVAASGTDPAPQQGFDLIALNGAISEVDPALPVDFDHLASAASNDYYNTQDAFKKKELLAALQPKLKERLEHFRQSPYIYTEFRYTNNIEGYDFNRGAFPVNVFKGRNMLFAGKGFGGQGILYGFELKNMEAASYFPVADQELARRIETLRTSGKTPYLKAYFSAELKPKNSNASAFHHYVTAEMPLTVTTLQLIDRDGSVLATYTPGQEVTPEQPSQVPANAASIANDV